MHRFETALTALPDTLRRHSVLPLRGALAPAEGFHAAVRAAGVGVESDIPHISRR